MLEKFIHVKIVEQEVGKRLLNCYVKCMTSFGSCMNFLEAFKKIP
jgi:hypothetical protein